MLEEQSAVTWKEREIKKGKLVRSYTYNNGQILLHFKYPTAPIQFISISIFS